MTIDPSVLAPGGLLVYYASDNPFEVGLGAILSEDIKLITHGGPSHSAIALPTALVPGPIAFQSTIFTNALGQSISGPQYIDTWAQIDGEYAHGHVFYYQPLPQFEPDWAAVVAAAAQMDSLRERGNMCYGVVDLFADLADRTFLHDIPGIADAEAWAYKKQEVVCSAAAALVLKAGGMNVKAGALWLPHVTVPASVTDKEIAAGPIDLIEMPLWYPPIELK